MTSEFDLIQRYFMRATHHTCLAGGDDAALIAVTPGMQLAISSDMLVAGTHFLADVDAYRLGWKTLAVNISDMAAMGAQPRWATLSLALPAIDAAWLQAYANGFYACADAFGVDLIGGDTTRGPLTLNVQIMGEIAAQQSLMRSGAKLGDEIWVSGQLGDAALALAALQGRIRLGDGELASCRTRLEQPQPRVALGMALRKVAHSAIDISDGLLADLGHILHRSCTAEPGGSDAGNSAGCKPGAFKPGEERLGAEIIIAHIPRSPTLNQHLEKPDVLAMMLSGGDDYELCFTAAAGQHAAIAALASELDLQLSHIGSITGSGQLMLRDEKQQLVSAAKLGLKGYDHFA